MTPPGTQPAEWNVESPDGATCYGIYRTEQEANNAAGKLRGYRTGAVVRALLTHAPPPEPGCQHIADAIAAALEAADMQIAVWHDGIRRGPDKHLALARCLDKAGLIDWNAFTNPEETP